jgi:phosphoglycerate dehydrogenase-like enzyme
MLNILFALDEGETKQAHFPPVVLERLEKLGRVTYNSNVERGFSEAELREAVRDMDVCLTHWGCPRFSAAVLENANRLGLIAHAAGSVGDLVSPEVYARGIRVSSANTVMAKYTAEGAFACILAGLRRMPQTAAKMQAGGWDRGWTPKSLHRKRVGLVGLGTIGRFLLDLMAPFEVQVKVYDPYLGPGALEAYPNARLAGLEEVLAWGDVVSVHAALTSETRGMLDGQRLGLIRDGALLVNTARGAIIDETALAGELRAGRIDAVLDVYPVEPLPADSPLRGLENAVLFPHSAGASDRRVEMSEAALAEIERFSRGEALQDEISLERFKLMTRQNES